MDIFSLIGTIKRDLTSSELGDLMVALCSYRSGVKVSEENLPMKSRVAFHIISALIDQEREEAEETAKAEMRRAEEISAKRSEAGRKGGRPKKQKNQKKQIAFLLSDEENKKQTNALDNAIDIIDNEDISNSEEKAKKAKKQIGILLFDEENGEIKEEETSTLSPTPPILTPEVEKEKITKVISKKKAEPDFSFVEDGRFLPVLQKWLDYKRQRGETYKPIGMKGCYHKLVELSGNDPEIALHKVVEFSIANNYAGLFREKDSERENVPRQRERASASDTPLDVNSRFNMDDYNF